MKCYTYIYGRTLNIDFREICSPENRLSEKTTKLVKELINTDVVSNGDINRLRYLFVRERQQVLFGVGFSHQQYLEKELWTDLTRRRELRSFVGIVIDKEEFEKLNAIPIDCHFFIKLYLNIIHRVWDLEDRPKNREIIISEISEYTQFENWCNLDGNEEFNFNDNYCRFFSPEKENLILRSLKKCTSSLAIGFNVESHVIRAFKRFNIVIPNAICLDTQDTHDYQLTANLERSENAPKHSNEYKRANGTIKSNSGERPIINREDRKPAILSSLRNYNLSNGDINKELSQDDELMNIDWGDDSMTDSVDRPKVNSNDSPLTDRDNTVVDSSVNSDDTMEDKEEILISEDSPKKVFRPRLILILIIVSAIVLLLMILRCQ